MHETASRQTVGKWNRFRLRQLCETAIQSSVRVCVAEICDTAMNRVTFKVMTASGLITRVFTAVVRELTLLVLPAGLRTVVVVNTITRKITFRLAHIMWKHVRVCPHETEAKRMRRNEDKAIVRCAANAI